MSPSEGPEVVAPTARPRLSPHVRLSHDSTRDADVLLGPEAVIVLNGSSAAILRRCDGERTVADITSELHEVYQRVVDDEVRQFLAIAVRKRFVVMADG